MSATAPLATDRPLLTVLDLAARLKVSRTTAQQLVYSGAIKSLKIQRSRRVSEEALAEYLHGVADRSLVLDASGLSDSGSDGVDL